MTRQERQLVREIRALLRPYVFWVKIWKNSFQDLSLEVTAEWISDIGVEITAGITETSVARHKLCTFWEFSQKLRELEKRVKDVCKASDLLAKEMKVPKDTMFESLLLEATQ